MLIDTEVIGVGGVDTMIRLRRAHFTAGESVLVRGAAGGIGVMAVQFAARGGASAVAVTTSSAERGDRLREFGATQVPDRAGQGDDAPDGYDVIVDIIAGPEMSSLFTKLNPNGRMVDVGAIAGFPPEDFGRAMFEAFRKSLSFATFGADTVAVADRRAATAELFADAVRAVVHEVLPLDQAVLAHRMMDAGAVFGRVMLVTRR